MEYVGEETLIENEDGTDEGWVETHHYNPTTSELEDKVCDMTLGENRTEDDIAGDMEDEINRDNENDDANDDDEEDEEAVDMEDFEESGMLHMVDPVCIISIMSAIKSIQIDSLTTCMI